MRKHVPEERKTDFTADHSHTLQDTYRALLHTQVHVHYSPKYSKNC